MEDGSNDELGRGEEASGFRLFILTICVTLCAVVILFVSIEEYREHAINATDASVCDVFTAFFGVHDIDRMRFCGRFEK